jgi:hypothetical protein
LRESDSVVGELLALSGGSVFDNLRTCFAGASLDDMIIEHRGERVDETALDLRGGNWRAHIVAQGNR